MFSLITLLFTLLTGSFTYTVDLPFQTLEQPQETILDEGMHDISLEFTLDMARFDETATEEELLDILNDCFDQAGAAFISLTIDSYMGGTDSNGIMTVHIPPSTTIDDRSFIFRYNNGNSSVGFSQDGMANPPATPEEPETPVVPEEPAEPDDEDDTLETEPANYIATETYVGDGSTSITDITYYGGLGYPVQEVRTSFAGRGRDLVTGILYDNMRRPDAKVLLPYVRTAGLNSHYEPELLSAQQQYYSENGFSDGTNACKVNTYDSGESGKLRSARIEGDMHSAADKKTTFKYRLNTTEDAVKKFIYTPAAGTAAATVTAEGTHSFGNLTVVSTTDEDERTKHVFSDRNGKVVLERRIDQNDNNDTYFIYDIKDSLVCVIQPMGVNSLPRTFSFNDSFAQKYCFTYRYDAFGNIIERHVPGAGTTRYAYDIRGRLVLYADDVMSTSKLYRYIIYDQMDRVCEEGYTKINTTLDSIRNMLLSGNDITAQFSNRYILRQCTYYEVPEVPEGFMAESGVVDRSIVEQARCITLLKTEKVYEDPDFSTSSASTPYWRERTFFYDGEGRTVQIVETDLEGWTSRYSSEYDFTGNVTAYVERHTKNTSSNYIRYEYTYDDRGRVTACHRTLNGRQFAPVFYDYDELGRKVLTDCSGRIVELQSYNQQGWPQTQDVLLYGLPAFQMRLSHYDPDNTEAVPSFAGLVCEALSCHNEQEPRFMTYGYDDLGRLVWAQQEEGDREEMQYDGNGNMLSIVRRNQSTTRSQSIFAYNGNLITSSRTDGSNATYSHHSNGNLKNNSAGNLTFSYNCSNLLTAIRRGTTKVADIIHLADGTKVQVKAANGTGLVYKGKFAYSLAGGRMTMESVAHDHGRFLTDSNNEFIDTWHVTDYLGSVRAVYDITQEQVADIGSVILEQNDYYAFGSRIEDTNLPDLAQNRYRFNGKERLSAGNTDTGLTDYGARMYAQQMLRWTTPDPLADKYYSTSPYAFSGNNPVNFVDPDGRIIETALDIASIGLGVRSLVKNIKDGNVRGAIGDGVGIVVDAAAAAIPFVPGGVGIARTAAKTVNAVDNLTDAVKATNTADNAVTAVTNSGTVVPTTRGETSHTKLGRKMHQDYNPGDGYVKEYKLPSGKRADAVNETTGDVRELKPNNPRAIKRGEQQVQAYKKELESKYPDIIWEWHIDVYDK